jgi:hypothetical protein
MLRHVCCGKYAGGKHVVVCMPWETVICQRQFTHRGGRDILYSNFQIRTLVARSRALPLVCALDSANLACFEAHLDASCMDGCACQNILNHAPGDDTAPLVFLHHDRDLHSRLDFCSFRSVHLNSPPVAFFRISITEMKQYLQILTAQATCAGKKSRKIQPATTGLLTPLAEQRYAYRFTICCPRRTDTSFAGVMPKKRLYSLLNCEGLSYPT